MRQPAFLVGFLVACVLASCNRGPPKPEVFLGSPGKMEDCTLAELQDRFTLDAPFAIVVDGKGPFPTERMLLRSSRVEEQGITLAPIRIATLTMQVGQTRFCVMDPSFHAGDFTEGKGGTYAIQVFSDNVLWAEKRFEVEAPKEVPAAAGGPDSAAPGEKTEGAVAGAGPAPTGTAAPIGATLPSKK